MVNIGDNPSLIVEALLDFNAPLDIDLLDRVITSFYSGNYEMQKIIAPFTEHELAWTRVDAILERSQSPHTRMVALRILDDCVEKRWSSLPRDQTIGIKNFIVNIILKISGDEKQVKLQSVFLSRLNVILINIVKREWPQNWPSFIPDIVESSKASMSICANNMQILQLLSEEVFDFSRGRITAEKAAEMKRKFEADLGMIYELCWFILDKSESMALLEATLKTLLRFLRWIPQDYIFQRFPLVEALACKFFPVSMFKFKILALQCMSEIASFTKLDKPEYKGVYRDMMIHVMKRVYVDIPDSIDLNRIYVEGDEQQQLYLRHLAIFITELCRNHVSILECSEGDGQQALIAALRILLRISVIDDTQQGSEVVLFDICLDYWKSMLHRVFKHKNDSLGGLPSANLYVSGSNSLIAGSIGMNTGMAGMGIAPISPMLAFYDPVITNLRQVLISKMAKPEEVLVVEDENGNVVRERVQNSDSFSLYLSMREALIYVMNLAPQSTIKAMLTQLDVLTSAEEWNPGPLNRLCWAIGSISRALPEAEEKTFLVQVLKGLLGHVKKLSRSEHKAVGAANVMYIVGQHPRFLKKHQRFLKTVLMKLFEFMHEPFPGVKDMCCDTIIKIAKKCKRTITRPEDGQPPIISEILMSTERNISDLEPSQVYTYYEAIACMVSVEQDADLRSKYVDLLMIFPNKTWAEITTRVQQSLDELLNLPTIDLIESVLKINVAVARSLKESYMGQLSRITLEMLSMYNMYSQFVSRKISEEGEAATRTVIIRKMRSVKKEVLRLITTVVDGCSNKVASLMLKEVLPKLGQTVLTDYRNNVPEARDAEVLLLFASFINQFKGQMSSHVSQILAFAFPPTLAMVSSNFEDFPEHRMALFRLLDSIISYCFDALMEQQPEDFKLVVDSAIWAFKHLENDIQALGLSMIRNLLFYFKSAPKDRAQNFYAAFLVPIFSELLEVLTDTFHRSGFSAQCLALYTIVDMVNSNTVLVPLGGPASNVTNQMFLYKKMGDLLHGAFPAFPPNTLTEFLKNLFLNPTVCSNPTAFENHIENFLIELKGYAGIQQNPNEPASWETDDQLDAQIEENNKKAHELHIRGLHYSRKGSSAFEDDDE